MKILTKRLMELEARSGAVSGGWHRIVQHIGQTFDDAMAQYQVCNGPVLEHDNLIVRQIVEP